MFELFDLVIRVLVTVKNVLSKQHDYRKWLDLLETSNE